MTRLLVLRPQPGADATAARARALGLDPIVAPLFEIRPVAWAAPDPAAFDAVLMTSANAARFADLVAFRHLPLYAVGKATAAAARHTGFDTIVTGEADARAAIDMAVAAGKRRLFHPVGREHVAADPSGAMIERRIVYASERCGAPELPGDAPLVALLHSTRAAHVFAELVAPTPRIAIAAISPAVAVAAGQGWGPLAIAEAPDDECLLAAAARLCDQMGR
jgi:uroporphyrinogen-III synthase